MFITEKVKNDKNASFFIIPLIFTKGCKDCSFGTFNDREHGDCKPWTEYVSFLSAYKIKYLG